MNDAFLTAFAFFIVGLVILGIYVKRQVNRSLRCLAEQPCARCGALYGRIAAVRAMKEHGEECAQAQKENPSLRIRFASVWFVECPSCFARGAFDYDQNQMSERMTPKSD